MKPQEVDRFVMSLSGFIRCDRSGGFQKIYLEQDSGLKIDLVSRFSEAVFSFGGKCFIKHWTSDKKDTDENMVAGAILLQLGGELTADYSANSYFYSEYTQGTEYDTNLNIGGYDLLSILEENKGKYCLFEAEFSL